MHFPDCEKVVKTIAKDLDSLEYRRVVFRCDNELSILALLRAVELVWQWSSARNVCRGRPAVQRRCRKFGEKRHQRHVRSIKLAVESASGVVEIGRRHTNCECGGCRCSHQRVVWALWFLALSKAGIWDQWMDRTRSLLALQVAL